MEDVNKFDPQLVLNSIYNGIQSIGSDESVVLTDKSSSIFKKLLDFYCKVYTVKESEAKARKLDDKFKKWAVQFK